MVEIKKNVSLKTWNSWHVGGSAAFFCIPHSQAELIEALKFSHHNNIHVTVLGSGTNVLISDTGIDGLVICLKKMCTIKETIVADRLILEVGCGALKTHIQHNFYQHKLAPAIFLTGIPGTVGGGVVMNAGIGNISLYPNCFAQIVTSLKVLRLDSYDEEEIASNDLNWSYRSCTGWQPGIITSVQLSWPLTEVIDVVEQIAAIKQQRRRSQPLDMPNCGSVFKNPPGQKAGYLIESCGLKGLRVGDAKISEKHANFIVNCGNASAQDIYNLIGYIQHSVLAKFNVQLHTEVMLLGNFV